MLLDDFFGITKQTTIKTIQEELKVIHVNINGIVAKKYKVIEFLNNEKPDILALSETHLKGNDEFSASGYEWVGVNYEQAIRGNRGVGFLIKSGIEY